MKDLDLKNIKKLTLTINSIILVLVFGLAGFFHMCGARYLVLFSIPTALVYIFGYYFITHDRLDIYVRSVYIWLTLYMSVTTIGLGYKLGFHLYCLSMIPIIFYTEYMAGQLGKKKINAVVVSVLIVLSYLFSTGYAAFSGPVYKVDNSIAGVFWLFNSAIVLYFLIVYSGIMLKMVGDSEKRLIVLAHTDRLTGLFNRHFMMSELEDAIRSDGGKFVAMADIDFFKRINDQFGHNAGDYVLRTISTIMKEQCPDGKVSRWGGEQFLLLSSGSAEEEGVKLMEKIRTTIESYEFTFEGKKIPVTITAGVSDYVKGTSVDEWINEADENLYFGKRNGRNRVVLKRDTSV